MLSDILADVGIDGVISEVKAYQDASCSELAENGEVKDGDKVLFRVYEKDDEWYVDAVNAFQTEHGLVINTADGAEYKIRVTDDVSTDVVYFMNWDKDKNELVEDYIGGDSSIATSYNIINDSSDIHYLGTAGNTSWYFVSNKNNVYKGYTVTISGDVHLILQDGCLMWLEGSKGDAGISVNGGNRLTIYGQSGGTGELVAEGGEQNKTRYGAGIGGNSNYNGENITINGGMVTATGAGYAAGIGGGKNGTGRNITINGGKVTATGGSVAAGIGGGEEGNGENITINGGKVTAKGCDYAAGIGGGRYATGKNITVNGGTVTAKGGSKGSGIGGGEKGNGENIIINGGTVTATAGDKGSGIGGGRIGTGINITVNGGTVTATGGCYAAAIGGSVYGTGKNIKINGGTVTATGGYAAAGIGGGDTGTVQDIVINGGTVKATGGSHAAAIGAGGEDAKATNIAINGGTVTANGGTYGAGIGCGLESTVDGVTIAGGEVKATGGTYAAGIGCGSYGNANNITISGGELTAAGGSDADAIGKSADGQASNIKATEGVGVWVSEDNSNFAVIKAKGLEEDITNLVKNERYAKSSTTQYSVKYDANGATGGTVPVDDAGYGLKEEVTVKGNTGNLEKSGLPFAGWATRKEATDEGYVAYKEGDTFNIEGDTTLYAQWGVPYIAADGATQVCKNYTVVASASEAVTWNAGWYVVDSPADISGSVTCVGDVNLILRDKTKLTVTGTDGTAGITVSGDGNSLTIYGQTYGTGKLEAKGGGGGAGIGGGSSAVGNKITINGGIVVATGGTNGSEAGAGIGGGNGAAGSEIRINRGIVRATGGDSADGIGNGKGVTSSSGISAAKGVSVWAGDTASPSNLILHDDETDIASELKGKKYVIAMNLVAVPYIDKDGATQSCAQYTLVEDSDSAVTWNAGWYVVGSDTTISNNVICNGDVHLILKDNSELTVTGVNGTAGITVEGSVSSLTVYGQLRETGALTVTGGTNGGAGIGGDSGKAGNKIYIYGGAVTATGGSNGDGIGSGNGGGDSSEIKVADVMVVKAGDTASSSTKIDHSSGENIAGKLHGNDKRYATVKKAYKVTYDANGATSGDVPVDYTDYYIYSEVTVASKSENLKRTGYSFEGWAMTPEAKTVGKIYKAGDTFNITADVTLYAQWSLDPVTYIEEDGREAICSEYTVVASNSEAWNAGWYVVYDSITLSKGAVCNGAVNLILKDGSELTASGVGSDTAGIKVSGDGNSLTIYGQSGGTGKLTATGGTNGAGIGGANSTGDNIIINGGIITATGGNNGAGIGGGNGTAREITINGGVVEATGGSNGAGIGGGNASGSRITINRGLVIATGSEYGAGIGGGNAIGSEITINGGIVRAKGGNNGAGIGGGNATGSEITINGGSVTANGGDGGAGIGGGNATGSEITINYGTVNATGGARGAGIGGGANGAGNTITVTGGTVDANAGAGGAGIGGGYNGNGSEITINNGTVTATGAGAGAGIGGGLQGVGSNIKIMGGNVTATGGNIGSGIGNGGNAGTLASNISAKDCVEIKADDTTPPTKDIEHKTTDDIASSLAGKRYVTAIEGTYTVTFDVQGHGKAPDSQSVAIGGKATKPATPTETGYTFCGWYKESGCTNAWDFDSDTVEGNKTLYAKWILNSYEVSFNRNGHGTAPYSQIVKYGEKVEKPATPTETGYTFGGWFKDSGCSYAWDFANDTVTGDRTLYAKWVTNQYIITWDAGAGIFQNGNKLVWDQVNYGTTPTAPASPSQSATAEYTYEFTGWTPAISSVTGTQTYTAKYSSTKRKYNITFKNYDGTVLKSTEEEYGTTPSYSGTPTRPDDSSYYYTFAGWSPAVSAVTGAATYTATYTSTKKSSGGGGGSSGGGGGSVSASSGSGITGAKAATTPITVAADGTQMMGTAVASKPLAMFTASEQLNIYRKGGQTAWVVSNGHYQLKDAVGNLIKNQWALVSDDLSSSGIGNVSKFYFDENGYMVIGLQWIKDADGIYRQYFFNDENGPLLGSCLMGGTKDDKILNEKGQVTGYVIKPAT